MSTNNNGGYAFPVLQHTSTGYLVMSSGGMSLRDYLAAKVMQGICANQSYDGVVIPEIAKEAYQIADAMLRARES